MRPLSRRTAPAVLAAVLVAALLSGRLVAAQSAPPAPPPAPVAVGGGAAGRPAVMTPDLLWQLHRVAGPAVSPDGRTVVYTVTVPDMAANRTTTQLWRVPTDGGAAVPLTTDGRNSDPQWLASGRIAYLSTAGGASQVWTMDADGSDARPMTAVEGGVDGFEVSPTGRRVALVMRVQVDRTMAERHPDLPLAEARLYDDLMMRHWNAWADGTFSHLFVADLGADGTAGPARDLLPGQRVDTPLAPFGGTEQVAWHPDGERVAYTAKLSAGTNYAVSTNSDVFLHDVRTGLTTNLTQGMMGYDVEPAFSPDGRRMAWNSMETDGNEADRNRLFVLDLASGQRTELSAGFDGNANHPAWTPDGRTILATTETDGTVQMLAFPADPSGAGSAPQPITEGVHNIGGFSVGGTAAAPVVVAERQSMLVPTDLYRVETDAPGPDAMTRLTSANAERLDGLDYPSVVEKRVATTDGQTMLVWEVRPPGFDAARRYPAILYMQGGPQSALTQSFSYRWNFHALAAQGYVVVAPNRRGMPGHGTAWNEQISGDWGGQAQTDLLSAIDAAAREPYVDPARLAAVGASYGGYSAFWLEGHHEGRFKTIVAHAGIFNLESMYGSTEELFFVEHDFGGRPWDTPRPASYTRFSPSAFVDRWDTPMLITAGEQDFRVPLSESLQAYTTLRRRGVEARFLSFPAEGHWINRPQNSLLWHREFYGWLARFLAP